MKIFIGGDHRGYNLKELLKNFLRNNSHEVVDVGDNKYDESDDYPDFAMKVAEEVAKDSNARGIVLCGSGVGVDVVANKFKNIRSALAFNEEQAKLSRSDDDANVLALAADFIDQATAEKILGTWLNTAFSGEEDHKRRLSKISDLESK